MAIRVVYVLPAHNFRLTEVNMASAVAVTFLLTFFLTISHVFAGNNHYAFARIESCSGCSLNRYLDVKDFIFKDVPEYNNVEFKHIQGAVPVLVVFNHNDQEVERIPLSMLTRSELNELLVSKGFTKKIPKDEM